MVLSKRAYESMLLLDKIGRLRLELIFFQILVYFEVAG